MQLAEALDAAHRNGIVRRDLKPGNIMLTPTGAKLLDFGLARAVGVTAAGQAAAATLRDLTAVPTLNSPLTRQGTLLGTFQYMAPEQLDGREADQRSDVFALGAVLYEMLTGRKAFDGKTQVSVMAAILEHDPSPVSLEHAAGPLLEAVQFQVSPPAGGVFQGANLTPRMAISPDGTTLAFTVNMGGGRTDELWIRRPDTLDARPLPGATTPADAVDQVQQPFWSPDSREVAFFVDGKLRKVISFCSP
jgi:serine/threonine protein kinase